MSFSSADRIPISQWIMRQRVLLDSEVVTVISLSTCMEHRVFSGSIFLKTLELSSTKYTN